MGKVTVKHYLNTEVKPVIGIAKTDKDENECFDENNVQKFYPVYFRITVKRKTTKLKSRILSTEYLTKLISERMRTVIYVKEDDKWSALDAERQSNLYTIEEFEKLKKKEHPFSRKLETERETVERIFLDLKLADTPTFDIKDFIKYYEEQIISVGWLLNLELIKELKEGLAQDPEFYYVKYLIPDNSNFSTIFESLSKISRRAGEQTKFHRFLYSNFGHLVTLEDLLLEYIVSVGQYSIPIYLWFSLDHYKNFEHHIKKNLTEKEFLKIYGSKAFKSTLYKKLL